MTRYRAGCHQTFNDVWFMKIICSRAGSRFTPSQWYTALPCNDVSHWLDARQESALPNHVRPKKKPERKHVKRYHICGPCNNQLIFSQLRDDSLNPDVSDEPRRSRYSLVWVVICSENQCPLINNCTFYKKLFEYWSMHILYHGNFTGNVICNITVFVSASIYHRELLWSQGPLSLSD